MLGVVRVGHRHRARRSRASRSPARPAPPSCARRRTASRCPTDPEACADQAADDPTDTDAWFAAYAPAGDGRARIAVGVLLVGAGAGGDTAAPAARGVLLAGLKR